MSHTDRLRNNDALGLWLRAAEVDADRFQRGDSLAWEGRAVGHGRLFVMAAVTLLVIAAATLMAQSATDGPGPQVTVLAHPGEPLRPAAADAPAARPLTGSAITPRVAAAPWVIDGGDVDTAAAMPARVLTSHLAVDTLPVAPMNVPTLPDPLDRHSGEAEPVGEPGLAGTSLD